MRLRTPEIERLFTGVSVFETLEQAQDQIRQYPQFSQFVAEIDLPSDAQADCERTTRTEGHWTIWESPDPLLARVVQVTAIDMVG